MAGITAGVLVAAPASALACPACVLVGASDSTWAYRAMSAMLIVLPLAMIGAVVWWLARLAARAEGGFVDSGPTHYAIDVEADLQVGPRHQVRRT